MIKDEFTINERDKCVYTKTVENVCIIVCLYVDDIAGCLKITADKSVKKQNLSSGRKANHRHQRSTKTRGLKPASRHHCKDQDARVETRVSTLLQYQNTESKARVSHEA